MHIIILRQTHAFIPDDQCASSRWIPTKGCVPQYDPHDEPSTLQMGLDGCLNQYI